MNQCANALLGSLLVLVAACPRRVSSNGPEVERTAERNAVVAPQVGEIESTLFGVALGSTVAELQQKFPKIYSQRLALGEILYEACNQKDLVVFTFTEEPWSPTRITYISARIEPDVSVCRDPSGALPDFGVEPRTPRQIALGASRASVLRAYGPPFTDRIVRDRSILEYRRSESAPRVGVDEVRFYFTLRNDKVERISLQGKMPGAKVPS